MQGEMPVHGPFAGLAAGAAPRLPPAARMAETGVLRTVGYARRSVPKNSTRCKKGARLCWLCPAARAHFLGAPRRKRGPPQKRQAPVVHRYAPGARAFAPAANFRRRKAAILRGQCWLSMLTTATSR